MLEVNTKVMIKSDRFHKGAHNGQIGTIVHIYPEKNKSSGWKSARFEVRLNKEHLGDSLVWLFDDEMVEVKDLAMPVEPVDPEQMKNWVAEAKKRAGA
tara:strand:+ start:485 stop:778 length:294 start_codon:yes stop_codon:yes gene_type:complete